MYVVLDDLDKSPGKTSWDFIYDDIPVGCWSLSWNYLDDVVTGKDWRWAVAVSNIINSKVIYQRSEVDYQKLAQLQNKVSKSDKYHLSLIQYTLKNYHPEGHIEKLEQLKENKDIIQIKKEVWGIINSTTVALSKLNNKYYTKNFASHLSQTFQFDLKPNNLDTHINILVCSSNIDEIIIAGRNIIYPTKDLLVKKLHELRQKITTSSNKEIDDLEPILSKDYPGYVEIFNKIRKGMIENDIYTPSWAVMDLENWLSKNNLTLTEESPREVYHYFNFPKIHNLIDQKNFQGVIDHVNMMENYLLDYYSEIGEKVNIFNKFEDVNLFIGSGLKDL